MRKAKGDPIGEFIKKEFLLAALVYLLILLLSVACGFLLARLT